MFNPVSEVSNLMDISIQQNQIQKLNGEKLDSSLNSNGHPQGSSLMEAIAVPEQKKVLDRMARIDIDLLPDQPMIVSYHYEYKEYLDEFNLMDVCILNFLLNFKF